jgi:hypothetical protein
VHLNKYSNIAHTRHRTKINKTKHKKMNNTDLTTKPEVDPGAQKGNQFLPLKRHPMFYIVCNPWLIALPYSPLVNLMHSKGIFPYGY